MINKYATLENCKDQIKICASRLHGIAESSKYEIQERTVNILNINSLKVAYFKIHCYGRQSPLSIKIIQDKIRPTPGILTIYTSFHKEFPDGLENDSMFTDGKNKIYAPKNARTFNNDYCYFSVLSTIRATFCCVYYFSTVNPISLVWDKDIGSYRG